MDLEESVPEGGEVALMLEYDQASKGLCLRGYSVGKEKKMSENEIRNKYLSEAMNCADVPDSARAQVINYFLGAYRGRGNKNDESPTVSILASKYKPVALKV